MSLNQVYLNLQKQHQPSVFIMTNIDKKIMTFWVGFLNSKVTRQHAAHLLNSSADPGHVGSNVGVDVEHIFLCKISFRRCCLVVHCSWSQATNVHLSTLEGPNRADKTDQTATFCRQGSSAVTLESSCETCFVRVIFFLTKSENNFQRTSFTPISFYLFLVLLIKSDKLMWEGLVQVGFLQEENKS